MFDACQGMNRVTTMIMNNEKKISIIVPVYNSKEYLDRCIYSIINQTYKNLEILLIDDGSTDNSGDMCDNYCSLDNRIQVYHKKNEGQATARNMGIELATGTFIGFVDSDDWIEPEMYEKLTVAIEGHDLSMCGRYTVNERTGKKTEVFCSKEKICFSREKTIEKFLLTDMVDGSPCDKLFKRELIGDIRFPAGYMCEDLPFVYQYLVKCKSICHLGLPQYNYLQRMGSTSKSRFSEKTYGLIMYSKEIENDVRQRFPALSKEAHLFYVIRKYLFFKDYFAKETKNSTSVEFLLSDYKCLRCKEKVICLLMKFHLYKYIYALYRKCKNITA